MSKFDFQSKFAVYGAGQVASLIYTYCKVCGTEDNIQYFIVTKRGGNDETWCGKPVRTLDDAAADEIKDGCIPVLLAMDEVSSRHVAAELEKYGLHSAVQIDYSWRQEMDAAIFDFYCQYPLEDKVFLESAGGRSHCDSQKYIEQTMQNREDGKDVKFVWGGEAQKYSPEFFFDLFTSKVIVTSIDYPHTIKRHGQVCICTWHGFAFKYVGMDEKSCSSEKSEYVKMRNRMTDIYIASSEHDTTVYRQSFVSGAPIYDLGSPRNDILFDEGFDKYQVYDRLGIDHSKKIALYAPTFRDDVATSLEKYVIDCNEVVQSLNKKFGGEFVFVYRFHPLLSRFADSAEQFAGCINATSYPDQMELLAAADVLISDYSSIAWDYSLTRRPVFMLQNDLEEYERERGFYFPPEEWPYERAFDNEELCNKILDFNGDEYLKRIEAFIGKYKSYDDGHASDRCCDLILSVLKHPEYYMR
ncbi:MAG: CDP-glycerol glycerophosphotransferase family protein [Bacteroidales bacterium]|nr:CDP-glycerol glycerophosphotransferase family protein [Bacteroidales bacterium]